MPEIQILTPSALPKPLPEKVLSHTIDPKPVAEETIQNFFEDARLDLCDCSHEAKQKLKEPIEEFYDVFAFGRNLGACSGGEHTIDAGALGPVTAKAYRVNRTSGN